MIALAWLVSLSWSLPQAVVYEVDGHPFVKDFYQCITFNFFSNAPQQRVSIAISKSLNSPFLIDGSKPTFFGNLRRYTCCSVSSFNTGSHFL